MFSNAKNNLVLILLIIFLFVCTTLILAISFKTGEGYDNIAYADSYGLYVANVAVTGDNLTIDSEDNSAISSGQAVFDSESNTLTLTDFSYTGPGYNSSDEGGAIDYRGGNNLTIVLVGTNTITKSEDNGINNSYGIYFNSNNHSLIMEGEGSLTISFSSLRTGSKSNGIFCEPGAFVMNGGTVTSNAGVGNESAGIYTSKGITFNGGTFIGNGNLTTAYESRGIYSHGVVTVNGGIVKGTAPINNTYAARAFDTNNVKINSGTVIAYGNTPFSKASGVTYGSSYSILAGENEEDAQSVTTIVNQSYKYVHIVVVPHQHDFAYQANGATITAVCQNANCMIKSGLELTINVPDNLLYDGNSKAATISAGYNAEIFESPVIKYYKEDDEITAQDVKTAGNYVAKVAYGAAIAQLNFTILKIDPTYIAPTDIQATYGDTLSGLVLPTGWIWENALNKVGNVGIQEHVAIYTPEDTINYNSLAVSLPINVVKANPTYVIPTNIEAPYGVTLDKVALPEGFYWMDATQYINTWGAIVFKAKYTPEDTQNYNKVENIDINVSVKWILIDPTQDEVNVEIGEGETQYNINVKVKVEIKTEISVEAKRTDYANLANGFVAKDEDIARVYDVKLIRTTDGVEEVIQPSDIKEGQIIKISMAIPQELQGKTFRLIHIHSAEDIAEVSKDSYAITADGKTIIMETDKLSEFVFITKTGSDDNGFVYDTKKGHGFCMGWVLFILTMIDFVFACLYILLKYGIVKIDKMSTKMDLLTIIGGCASLVLFIFAIVALCLHQCTITIIAFIIEFLLMCLFGYFLLKNKKIISKNNIVKKEAQPTSLEDANDKQQKESERINEFAPETVENVEIQDVARTEEVEAHEKIALKDSLLLAKATSSSHKISKKTIADYLKGKHKVEVNERDNFTRTGLPLADTHYVYVEEEKKCFAYVYETKGSVMLLAKMDKEYATKLQGTHSQINLSAFPKQKNTWYSLIIDDTYTKEEIEAILDELIGETQEAEGIKLKESIALAKANTTTQKFTKAYVCEYLKDRKDIELNTRENYTRTGLPLADTHYVEKEGKKICFAYIYEIEGSIILLARMNTKYANELKKMHPQVYLSAFPKQKDTWYSLIIDNTYTKEEFEKIIEDVIKQV